jgi:hypothetical protein
MPRFPIQAADLIARGASSLLRTRNKA